MLVVIFDIYTVYPTENRKQGNIFKEYIFHTLLYTQTVLSELLFET